MFLFQNFTIGIAQIRDIAIILPGAPVHWP